MTKRMARWTIATCAMGFLASCSDAAFDNNGTGKEADSASEATATNGATDAADGSEASANEAPVVETADSAKGSADASEGVKDEKDIADEASDTASTSTYSGDATMNGSASNGEMMEVIRAAAGGKVELDVRFGYLAMAGSFDLADACADQLAIPDQPSQKGINGQEHPVVVTPGEDLWDYSAADVGNSVVCKETITFKAPGYGPDLIGEGAGIGYYAVKGTWDVEKRREGKRTRFILTKE